MGHHISSSPPDTLEYPLSIAGDTANITDIVFKDERVHFQAIDDEDSVDIVQAQGTRLARISRLQSVSFEHIKTDTTRRLVNTKPGLGTASRSLLYRITTWIALPLLDST